ncbi:hypothetical protein, partial [Sphingomonas sp.]|uniref:hypothetical protein n=1 Tax=Sphingomonas sp. TaxID=28214 RepID=UPI003B3A6C6B
ALNSRQARAPCLEGRGREEKNRKTSETNLMIRPMTLPTGLVRGDTCGQIQCVLHAESGREIVKRENEPKAVMCSYKADIRTINTYKRQDLELNGS